MGSYASQLIAIELCSLKLAAKAPRGANRVGPVGRHVGVEGILQLLPDRFRMRIEDHKFLKGFGRQLLGWYP